MSNEKCPKKINKVPFDDSKLQSTSFEMTLFDDDYNREKYTMLSKLEIMFDDSRNVIPEDGFQYFFCDKMPWGSKVRVTFELLEEGTGKEEEDDNPI